MKYTTLITYTATPGKIGKAFKRGLPSAMQSIVLYWAKQRLPRHFETGAVSEYNYTPRSKGYMVRKAKTQKHQKPLVWSGALREKLVASMPTVETRGKSTKAVWRGMPRYLYARRNKGASQINKIAELRKLNAIEVQTFGQMAKFEFERIRKSITGRITQKLGETEYRPETF